jgi:hypothetical protein
MTATFKTDITGKVMSLNSVKTKHEHFYLISGKANANEGLVIVVTITKTKPLGLIRRDSLS